MDPKHLTELNFQRHALVFGLEPRHFGQTIQLDCWKYQICGLNPKGWAKPVLVRAEGGKIIALPLEPVKRALAEN